MTFSLWRMISIYLQKVKKQKNIETTNFFLHLEGHWRKSRYMWGHSSLRDFTIFLVCSWIFKTSPKLCCAYCQNLHNFQCLERSVSISVSPKSNPNCINAGTTAGLFRYRLWALSKIKRTGDAALWRIFLLDSRTLKKITIAAASHLQTSKANVIR